MAHVQTLCTAPGLPLAWGSDRLAHDHGVPCKLTQAQWVTNS